MPVVARTLSREVVPAAIGAAPHLFLALVCDRPEVPSVRLSLRAIDRVSIGRGDLQRGHAPLARSSQSQLALTVPDDRMSTTHATLRRVMGTWMVEDSGSRNGTLINGRRVQREPLSDGDVIELGHSFFLFRTSLLPPSGAPAILYSSEVRPAATGLETLLPSVALNFLRAEAVARSNIPLVIRGETGTGKEVLASAIHALSGRQGPFVPVNCGALSSSLVQSELLGHCKGAFAEATDDRPGFVRSAQGGTLFLDVVEDLPPAAQPLLLRVLQEAEVLPLGAARPVKVDVRVLAATQRNLDALAEEQHFRSDLLARLSGVTLELPPLRERREDLGLLIRALLRRQLGDAAGRIRFTCEAARALFLHRWPLNVRELENALQAAVVFAGSEPIGLRHLPAAMNRSPSAPAQPREAAATPHPTPGGTLAVRIQHFIDELSRRHVARVLVAYAVAVFGALQGADVIVTRLSLPPQWMTWIVAVCLAGFPVAGILAWIFDWTRQGIVRTAPISEDQRAILAQGRRRRKRRLALAGCALALTAATGAIWWRTRWRSSASARQNTEAIERKP
jgi:hypothetical protein